MSEQADGFTLVEVIIVVVLMGLVTSAVAFAAMTMMRVLPTNGDRVDLASGQTSVATWLGRDLAAVPPQVMSTVDGGVDLATERCPGSGVGTHVVGLAWRAIDRTGVEHYYVVDYRLVDDPENGSKPDEDRTSDLIRFTCGGTAADFAALTSTGSAKVGGDFDQVSDQTAPTASFDVPSGLVTVSLGRPNSETLTLTLAPRSPL